MGSQGSTFTKQVLTAQSALDTRSAIISTEGFENLSLFVVTSAGVSAGGVRVEGAATGTFTTTPFIQVAEVLTGTATTTFGSVVTVRALAPYIRAHISTVISGGTVDVYIVMN